MTSSIRVERCTGRAIERYIPELARLRIEVFRAFPYLYDGDYDYEARYLQTYVEARDAVVVVAFDGEAVIGASTGMPLAQETEEFRRPFLAGGYDVERVFYCAESVLRSPYRGRGLGVRFFTEREAHARALGGFDYSCFCRVARPDDHPLRPPDYVPLDRFWQKRGYREHPELVTRYRWKDVGQAQESDKDMTFWLKRLAA